MLSYLCPIWGWRAGSDGPAGSRNFSSTSKRPACHAGLDVTLAYHKGKDVKSEEAQEHANSSSLAPYA